MSTIAGCERTARGAAIILTAAPPPTPRPPPASSATSWRAPESWGTPPTAPGNSVTTRRRRARPRSSSCRPCARPWSAASTSTTSTSRRRPPRDLPGWGSRRPQRPAPGQLRGQLPDLPAAPALHHGQGRSGHRAAPHHRHLVAARAQSKTEDFDALYRRWRPMVERSLAWLTRGMNRELRERGVERNQLWWSHHCHELGHCRSRPGRLGRRRRCAEIASDLGFRGESPGQRQRRGWDLNPR